MRSARARGERLDAIARELQLVRARLADLLLARDARRRAGSSRIATCARPRSTFGALDRASAGSRTALIGRLADRRAALVAWMAEWGVFRRCPVDGPNAPADNFGIIVRLPHVPVHRHMGDDIAAAEGTPIVAPFAGIATASSSELGGLEVRVTGASGYVYNAHLSSYGTLGPVRLGQVIGYVGHTGDATAPHDHFEWHPGNGPAVDPQRVTRRRLLTRQGRLGHGRRSVASALVPRRS